MDRARETVSKGHVTARGESNLIFVYQSIVGARRRLNIPEM
jgi:hypothetical protein